jgi:hypothetical protein
LLLCWLLANLQLHDALCRWNALAFIVNCFGRIWPQPLEVQLEELADLFALLDAR